MSATRESLSGKKVLAFDWDGTLINSVPYKVLQNQLIAEEFGNKLTTDEVRRIWNESKGFSDLMAKLTNGADMTKIMEVVGRDYNHPDFAKRAFEFDVKGALTALKTAGFQLALLTSASREILDKDTETVGVTLDDFFDYIQTEESSEFKKPNPEVFNPLLGHFGIQASELVYVGDELKDYQATDGLGARFIGVTTGMMSAEDWSEHSGVAVIESVWDLTA